MLQSLLSLVALGGVIIGISSQEPKKQCLSYEDIFQKYYEMIKVDISFDSFVEGYYSSNLTIDKYTEEVSNQESLPISYVDDSIPASSETANYILGPQRDVSNTPKEYFQRKPVYKDFSLYRNIFLADIVYETNTIFGTFIGHNALITSLEHDGYYGKYIQTIEAVSPYVSYGFLDDDRMVRYKVKMLGVDGQTIARRWSVINYATQALGKPYSLDHSVNDDMNGSSWYCSELVYVAYKKVNIYLCTYSFLVTPKDIDNSKYTYDYLSWEGK